MSLLTDTIRERLLQNGRLTAEYRFKGEVEPDFLPVVKLFTPDAGCAWLLTELDPEDPDIAFGLCDLGMGYPELGSVRISELESIGSGLALPIERDLHFNPTKTLSAYAEKARARSYRVMSSGRARSCPGPRVNDFLSIRWLCFLMGKDNDSRLQDGYELSCVGEQTPAWRSYHEIARKSLFKTDEHNYYESLEMLRSYYERMTPLLLSFNGESVGTVAIFDLGDGKAALRMVAIDTDQQGRGHERALGTLAAEFAKSRGVRQLCVNADIDVVGYYAALGFSAAKWSPSEQESIAVTGRKSLQMVKDLG